MPTAFAQNKSAQAAKKSEQVATPERLKRAAKRLFAEKGLEAVPVREILLAAGDKNGASLNYYFGSKEDLIREIITDQFIEMDRRWNDRLREADTAGRSLDIRDLIRIIVIEGGLPFEGDDVPVAGRFALAVLQRRRHLVTDVFKQHRLQAHDKILGRIAKLITDIPAPVISQRLIFLTHYLSTILAAHEAAIAETGGRPNPLWSTVNDLGNLVDTAVGLVSAPVADFTLLNQNDTPLFSALISQAV